MWPWGHAAIGYVALELATLAARRDPPRRDEVLVALLGTQFPDLVDKPLAWTFAVLPSGRSLGHSLLTATLLVAVVAYLGVRFDRRWLAAAFGLGYLGGILGDVPPSVLGGDFTYATFLVWPLLPPPPYETDPSFAAHLLSIDVTPWFGFQLLIGVAVGLLALYRLRG